MHTTITDLNAFEILDSRGRPTASVGVELSNGMRARADFPSGASTGNHEAIELRDQEPDRYEGRGVLAAVGLVRRQIRDCLMGRTLEDFDDVIATDQAIRDLDGSDSLSRQGANAVIGVSMAITRAMATSTNTPLWSLISGQGRTAGRLPVPHCNVVNGALQGSW